MNMECEFDMKKILDNQGLWPCLLRPILDAMSNSNANRFAMTCKTSEKAVNEYRPEIYHLKTLIRNGCGYDATPYRPICSGGSNAYCIQIAKEAFINGSKADIVATWNAEEDFRSNGFLEAGCFMAYYCININEDTAFAFLSKDIEDENGLRRRAVRYFFRLAINWCKVHQWIINGHYDKFERALSFFKNKEKINFFDNTMDNCYYCVNPKGQNSMYYAQIQNQNGEKRFYNYITSILKSDVIDPNAVISYIASYMNKDETQTRPFLREALHEAASKETK